MSQSGGRLGARGLCQEWTPWDGHIASTSEATGGLHLLQPPSTDDWLLSRVVGTSIDSVTATHKSLKSGNNKVLFKTTSPTIPWDAPLT